MELPFTRKRSVLKSLQHKIHWYWACSDCWDLGNQSDACILWTIRKRLLFPVRTCGL